MVLTADGKVHSATVRDVRLNEAGQVKLMAKNFQTEANLIVRGKTTMSAVVLKPSGCPHGQQRFFSRGGSRAFTALYQVMIKISVKLEQHSSPG